MSNVKHATTNDFSDLVLKSEKPVLVDFWATWCGPCKSIAPLLDSLSLENESISVIKVDVDQNPDLATKYGIRGIPTMMLFEKGEVQATKVGAVTKASLSSWLESNS